MWTGRIRGLAWGTVDSCRARLNIDVLVRLREHVAPLPGADGRTIGTATLLNPTGSTVRNRYRNVCPGGSAAGRGTTTVTREDVKGGPGVIYRNTKNAPRRTANGIELQPGQEWYALSVAPDVGQEYDVIFRSGPHSSSSPSDFMYPVIGGLPIIPPSPFSDPAPRYVQEGRMSGAYVTGATGAFEKFALSWSICREGVRCPPLGSLPDEGQQQRCPEEALAEVCGDQLMSYLEEWEPMQEEYARLMELADSYYADYTTALRRCAAWKIVQTILETILGAQTAKLGQAGENAANALKWFEALIEGDPTGPLGDALMSDAEEAFKPLEIANKVKGYLEQGNQIGDVLSKSGDLNALRGAAMDACLGAVNPEIHMRAQKFIEYTRQAAEYYKNVFAPQMNDVDAKMRECADRESAAARACQ